MILTMGIVTKVLYRRIISTFHKFETFEFRNVSLRSKPVAYWTKKF